MKRVAVGDIMTRNFVSVAPRTDLLTCAKEMVKQRVNSLLITDNRRLIGIITSRDILWTIVKKPDIDLRELEVLEVATKKVAVIKPSADLSEALHKMKQYGFRRLPVIAKGELVGVITLKDILRVDPTVYAMLGEFAKVREEAEKLQRVAKNDAFPIEGLCDSCGSLAELLVVNGQLLCRDCREELY